MNKTRTMVAALFLLGTLATGCARVTTSVRQEDGTYRTSKRWVLRSDLPGRSFRCDEDYMVATAFHGVTYAWPQGGGNYSQDFAEITFQGRQLDCHIVGRELSVNGSRFAGFEEGDRVRITADGKVFVNDIPREPLGKN